MDIGGVWLVVDGIIPTTAHDVDPADDNIPSGLSLPLPDLGHNHSSFRTSFCLKNVSSLLKNSYCTAATS